MPFFKKKKGSKPEKIKTPKQVGQAEDQSNKTIDAMENEVQSVSKTIKNLKKLRKTVAVMMLGALVLKKADGKAFGYLKEVYSATDKMVSDLSAGNSNNNKMSKMMKIMKSKAKDMAKQKALGGKASAINFMMRKNDELQKTSSKMVTTLSKTRDNINVLEKKIDAAIMRMENIKRDSPQLTDVVNLIVKELKKLKQHKAVQAGKKASQVFERNTLKHAKKLDSKLSQSGRALDYHLKETGDGILV
ncbi:MAG: hypothetical protein AAF526_08895 [Pseudomonadota bacterium]